jgi:hypothetical protein
LINVISSYGGRMGVFSAVAVAGALLLITAGIGHGRHRSGLRTVLAAQRLFARRLHAPIATLTPLLELVVGGSVLMSHLAPVLPALAQTASLVAQAAMFAAFGGYLSVVRRHRPTAPCGCFGADGPISRLVIVRAGVLAAGTAGAALATGSGADSLAAAPPMVRLATYAAGALLAMAGWLVPALLATSAPGRVRRPNAPGNGGHTPGR